MTVTLDYLRPPSLILAGALALEALLGACGRPAVPTISVQPNNLEGYCAEFKRQEFVPYGASFVIRDRYDNDVVDLVIVTVPKDFNAARVEFYVEVLVKTRKSYPILVDEISKEGIIVTYGPKECFEPLTPHRMS